MQKKISQIIVCTAVLSLIIHTHLLSCFVQCRVETELVWKRFGLNYKWNYSSHRSTVRCLPGLDRRLPSLYRTCFGLVRPLSFSWAPPTLQPSDHTVRKNQFQTHGGKLGEECSCLSRLTGPSSTQTSDAVPCFLITAAEERKILHPLLSVHPFKCCLL